MYVFLIKRKWWWGLSQACLICHGLLVLVRYICSCWIVGIISVLLLFWCGVYQGSKPTAKLLASLRTLAFCCCSLISTSIVYGCGYMFTHMGMRNSHAWEYEIYAILFHFVSFYFICLIFDNLCESFFVFIVMHGTLTVLHWNAGWRSEISFTLRLQWYTYILLICSLMPLYDSGDIYVCSSQSEKYFIMDPGWTFLFVI